MPSDAFLHDRSDFKALVETVADSEKINDPALVEKAVIGIRGTGKNEHSSLNPAEMIAQGAPRVIHNDAELEMYTNALFRLTELERPSSSEVEAIELLTLLVERYEQEHYSIPETDPVSVVRFLIEQQNLTQRDLIPQFGSESAVSMFMTRERNLTIEQVRKLSTRFQLPTDVFIPKASAKHSRKRRAKGHSRPR